MEFIDWFLLGLYLLLTFLLGLWLARRNRGQEDYFVAGRRLNGWLAGASMAATTFSIDTPLYIAGLVGSRGLAGNWEWWSFGLAHVAMAVVFAPLWRRSGVLTDAAFTELRYGGAAAAWLRGIKAFLLALPVNCIGIGYAFLALRKVVEALGIVRGEPSFLGLSDTVWLLAIVALLVVSYTVVGGLWAVVMTDLVQLVLALLGALAVAVAALHATGGMASLLDQLQALNRPELLSLVPWTWDEKGFTWLDGAGISVPMFTAYIAVQWWSFRRSDGGGEFIQRMLATRDEQQARLAGWVFLVVNYLIRSWLWVVVALAALVLLPAQADLELGYPRLAVDLFASCGARAGGGVPRCRFYEHREHVGELGRQLPHPRSLRTFHSAPSRPTGIAFGWSGHHGVAARAWCDDGLSEQQHRVGVPTRDCHWLRSRGGVGVALVLVEGQCCC
jgi:Na+/proline symporter